MKILTTPWRDTQRRAQLAAVFNGRIRGSLINDEGSEGTEAQQEVTKKQLEIMIQPSESGNEDPPPEPV